MFDLRGSDSEGQGSESPVRGRMAVPADDREARKGDSLFRGDDVNNPLTEVVHGEIGDIEVVGVLFKSLDLKGADRVGDSPGPVGGGNIVVRNGKGQVRSSHLSSGLLQAFEGLGAGDLVNQLPVDIEKRHAALFCHYMGVPYFFNDCSGHRNSLLNRKR